MDGNPYGEIEKVRRRATREGASYRTGRRALKVHALPTSPRSSTIGDLCSRCTAQGRRGNRSPSSDGLLVVAGPDANVEAAVRIWIKP